MDIDWRPLLHEKGADLEWRDISPPPDLYEILEVSRRASPEVIARAYRILIEKYHPDRHPPERKADVEPIAKQLNEAYSVLRDPIRRAEYDRRMRYRI